MKSVKDYIRQGRIKKVSRDLGKAKGLLDRSRRRLDNIAAQDIQDSNAFMVLENAYESIREGMESLMALEGFSSEDHVATIAWVSEEINLSKGQINKLHKSRKLRNASRYEAEEITSNQGKEILKFAKNIHNTLAKEIEERLS